MPAKISKHARYQVNGTITLDQELRPSLNNCSSIITQAPQSMIQGSLNSMTNAKENWQHCCVQGLSNLQRIKLSSLNTGLGSATWAVLWVPSSSKLHHFPMILSSDASKPSLNRSMAAYVTCAHGIDLKSASSAGCLHIHCQRIHRLHKTFGWKGTSEVLDEHRQNR